MRGDFPDFKTLYAAQPWRDIAYHAALIEAEGYGHWPRIQEIAELSRRMSYRPIGLAHCPDMAPEARMTASYLEECGLEVVVPTDEACHPVEQARFFRKRGTQFNIICGMCVGHDSLFIRASSAPVTSLIARDSKLQHNPVAAIYTSESYFRNALYVSHRREKPTTDAASFGEVTNEIAREGRGKWCRIEETLELAHRIGARRLGIVFCSGFMSEAKTMKRVLEAHGFEVHSSCCKTGAVPKEDLGILDSQKVKPGAAEMACNPMAQAELLNREQVHLVLLLGQCVGHDSATMAHLDAPAVCLVAKDRTLGHNTVAALYRSLES
jgi:uncharacterized metal-binding protein